MVLLLGCLSALFLVFKDTNTNPLYKCYLLTYKLIPNLVMMSVVTW